MPNNSKIYLDATDKKATPNVLPLRVTGGRGKVMTDSKKVIDINLNPKISKKNTMLAYSINDEGSAKGKLQELYPCNHLAYLYRKKSKGKDEKVIDKLKEKYKLDEIIDYTRKGFKEVDQKVTVSYNFEKEEATTIVGDEIYFHPMLFMRTATNPFKLDKRNYPINYGYTYSKNHIINIKIPKGYTISSLPKNSNIKLSDNIGSYSYMIQSSESTIQLRVVRKISKGFISTQQYPLLKKLINEIVKKENEQIILKKI